MFSINLRYALVTLLVIATTVTAQTDPDDVFWDLGFSGPGVDGVINASLSTSHGLIVAGRFTTIDGEAIHGVALMQESPRKWIPLGAGISGEVFSLAVIGDWLYVGGYFDTAGGVEARNFARWSFATSEWEPIVDRGANGVDSVVRAIGFFNGKGVVGGDFRVAGNESAHGIANFDTSTFLFTAIDPISVINDDVASVYAIDTLGGDLYVGGRFDLVGSSPAKNLARWDGTTWRALGVVPNDGANARVHDILIDDGKVIVAGEFTRAGLVEVVGVSEWNPDSESWRGYVVPTQNLRGSAYAVARFGSDLIVGGPFTGAGFTDVTGVVRLSGSSWNVMGGDVQGAVNTIAVHAGRAIVGGEFNGVYDKTIFGLAAWSGAAWSAVATDLGGAGPTNHVYALALDGSKVYAGGLFRSVAGRLAPRFARWDEGTMSWDPIGDGTDGPVNAIAVGGGKIWIGGRFNAAHDVAASNIAVLDPASGTWEVVGIDFDEGVTGTIHALLVDGSTLYVGGDFRLRRGTLNLQNLAAFDIGTRTWWDPKGSPNGPVYAIAAAGSRVVFGGDFTSIGDIDAHNIAQYNPRNGGWVPLGSGVSGPVRALAGSGVTVYVGGDFVTAGVLSAPHIARWIVEPGYWDRLGDGLEGTNETGVYGLAVGGGGVWAAGVFERSGSIELRNVGRWDTTTGRWGTLGSGIAGSTVPQGRAIAANNTEVYVGGAFTHVGGRFIPYLARWTKTTSSVPLSDYLPSWLSITTGFSDLSFASIDGAPIDVSIVDMLGRRVLHVVNEGGLAHVSTESLVTGTYLVVVESHGRRSVTMLRR